MFARTQQQLAQQQQEAAEKAEAFAKEQQRLRLISLTQALAARALRKQDDRGALLARQAYLFHQRSQGHVLDQIDDALRTILSVPHFSHILRGHEDWVFSVAFSPDGQTLASGSADNTIRLWDLRQPAAAPTVLRGHENWVSPWPSVQMGRPWPQAVGITRYGCGTCANRRRRLPCCAGTRLGLLRGLQSRWADPGLRQSG